MKKIMSEAHKMTKEIVSKYENIDYKTQLGLCLSYLLNKESEEKDEVTFKTLETAAEKYVEEECGNSNGWYSDWYVNNWSKGEHDRSYIEIKEFRNGKLRNVIKCGYWDNKKNEYISCDRYSKILDLVEYLKGGM